MLRAALKYCGGCNPGYDRVLLADTVREQFVGRVEFVAAGSCADVDLVLVLAGCDTACADLSAFEGCETVVISSTKDAERMIAAALQTMSSRSPDDDEGTLSRRGATKGEENGSS